MRSRLFMVAISFVSLIISGKIYTGWRGYDHGWFVYVDQVIPGEIPLAWILSMNEHYRNLLLYNLPDALWMFALCGILIALWGTSHWPLIISWMCLALIMGLLLEIFQYKDIVSGTFDWLDLGSYLMASIVALVLFQILNRKAWKSG